MTIRRADLDNVYKAVESYCGANMASIVAIWGTGTNSSRTYYVVVNVYGVANPFQIWVITLTPNSVPGWTAVQSGTGYATPAAAVTAVDALVTALSVQFVPVGPLVQ